MIRALRNLLLLAAFGLLALPAAAEADPLSDCSRDGDLDRRYSSSQLRKALDNIPSDLDEYSNCREVIKSAISSGSDKRTDDQTDGSGGGGGGSDADSGGSVTPDEQQARANDNAELEAITGGANDKPKVAVGGERVEPGSSGLFDLASASNDVPVPLLLALIAIGVLAIAGGLVALRERVPASGRIPLVSKIPRVSLPRFRR